jgi:hypothetical protein
MVIALPDNTVIRQRNPGDVDASTYRNRDRAFDKCIAFQDALDTVTSASNNPFLSPFSYGTMADQPPRTTRNNPKQPRTYIADG